MPWLLVMGLAWETKIQLQNVLAAFSVPVFLGLSAEGGIRHTCVWAHVNTRGHVDVHTLIHVGMCTR